MPGFRTQRRQKLTPAVVTWLDAPNPDLIAQQTAGWDSQTWHAVRRVILTQGVGPYLHHHLQETPAGACLDAGLRDWLARHHALNAQRIRLLHEELHAILQAANRDGLRIMPLKGSVLSLWTYAQPALRPMADIDVLVSAQDFKALCAILVSLHYRPEPSHSPYPNHYRFINLRADTVVSLDDEHPQNPRPVEVHMELKRTMWQSSGAYDITEYLWQDSQPCTMLGETAWRPAPDRLLTYVAIHACADFLLSKGRALQWLDLGHLVQRGAAPDRGLDRRHVTWLYPVLKLASRALPQRTAGLNLEAMEHLIHPHLRRWAAAVPLDATCGLIGQPVPPEQVRSSRLAHWAVRWQRWRPEPWRLRIGYPDVPLPLAYGRHILNLAARSGALWRGD